MPATSVAGGRSVCATITQHDRTKAIEVRRMMHILSLYRVVATAGAHLQARTGQLDFQAPECAIHRCIGGLETKAILAAHLVTNCREDGFDRHILRHVKSASTRWLRQFAKDGQTSRPVCAGHEAFVIV